MTGSSAARDPCTNYGLDAPVRLFTQFSHVIFRDTPIGPERAGRYRASLDSPLEKSGQAKDSSHRWTWVVAAEFGNESNHIMCRILVIFEEYNEPGSVPEAALAVAASAEGDGAEVRLRTLEAAGLRDITWAGALAFGIDGRGARLPPEIKRWLDALGFRSWHDLRDKAGCVFATQGRGSDAATSCRMAARILRSRGMETVTAAELEVPAPPHDDDGTVIGQTFAQWCARLEVAARAAAS